MDKMLGDKYFSQHILVPCYHRKYFRPHFLIIIRIIKRNEKILPAGGTLQTHTLHKQVVVKYLNLWFWQTIPINQNRSIRNLSFCLSSNSFASFLILSQMSNLVQSSLHLVTQVYQPRPVSVLSVSCQLS